MTITEIANAQGMFIKQEYLSGQALQMSILKGNIEQAEISARSILTLLTRLKDCTEGKNDQMEDKYTWFEYDNNGLIDFKGFLKNELTLIDESVKEILKPYAV